ncbi:MAG: hypothetical protein HY850_04450 [Betaproteobacteria bacterium]|nr:hypothetical protein [Betaproteobacteria bacterium]
MRSTDPDAGAKISHAIRRAQEQAEPVLLSTYMVDAILKHLLPRPREQADLLIRWLAVNVPGPGETISVEFNTHGSVIGSKSPAGFKLVLDYLFSEGLVIGIQSKTIQGGDHAHATLSFRGWEYYEQLRQGGAVYRKAFMAMKFGDEQLTRVLEKVFKPSAKRAGFDLIKLDDVPKAGLIDDRLRVEIQSSDFIVADLTHDNLGAYWEAGYAEGLGKPVIYTCEKNKFASAKTHFDTNHHLTILWDASAPEVAGNDLMATIRATLPHLASMVDSDE